MTNADLERIVDTSDEWIRTRTGIRQRHIAEPGTPTSELAARAARMALEKRGIGADELDLIIIGTVTPDTLFPATACVVQDKIQAKKAWAFDISAACSGFTYALTMGAQFIASGAHRKVLVIGADVMSTIIDYKDRTTCVLFGDGAGAVLLEPSTDETGFIDFYNEVDGSGGCYLNMPAGGSARPASHETVGPAHALRAPGRAPRLQVRGAQVRGGQPDRARAQRPQGVRHRPLRRPSGQRADHRRLRERLGLPEAKVVKNIERYGNTTAATIPLALGTALDEGRLRRGHVVVMTSVGAGLTVGSILMRWSGVPGSAGTHEARAHGFRGGGDDLRVRPRLHGRRLRRRALVRPRPRPVAEASSRTAPNLAAPAGGERRRGRRARPSVGTGRIRTRCARSRTWPRATSRTCRCGSSWATCTWTTPNTKRPPAGTGRRWP
jgi:3-oxoacyl-[acyl-carrier-protein] synthase-3